MRGGAVKNSVVKSVGKNWGFSRSSLSVDLPRFSDRRRVRFYGIIRVLPGIELRGDGGTNGSHEGRWVETGIVLLRTNRKA